LAAPVAGNPGLQVHSGLGKRISRDDAPNVANSQPDTQVEPDIAADPRDGRYLVAVFQQGRFFDGGSVAPGYAHSSDGGRTWHTALLPQLTTASGGPFDRGSDAVVTFGPNGTVYANTLVFDVNDCRNGVAVQSSHDHGATFGPPTFIADTTDCFSNSTDKNWITVDTHPRSPYHGRLYAMWDEYNYDPSFNILSVPEIERYSDDGGATWSPRITVAGGFNGYPIPVVEPNGRVLDVHDLQDKSGCCVTGVAVNYSDDGGATFSATKQFDYVQDTGPTDVRYGGLVAATADPITGDLYAAWSDSRYNVNGRDDVLVSRSRNGGSIWSTATRMDASGASSQVDQLTPAIAAYDGSVYITYLRRDETSSTSAASARVVLMASQNHESTFHRVAALGPPSTLADAAYSYNPPAAFLGDYTGLAIDAHGIYAAWEVASPSPSKAAQHQVTWAVVLKP
jgi:hypothetical protein